MTNVTAKKKSHAKLIAMIVIDILVISALVLYFGVIRPSQHKTEVKINGLYLPKATDVSDFKLTDNHGKTFTVENLKGHWTMLFFGFTNCAMVCPTTMDALNKMYKILEKDLPADKLPQVVLVSVDPDRDTVERMDDYVNSFNKSFIGVRTEIEDTVKLEKQFHIAAAKMEVDGQGKNHYTVNHSAEILLINPDAKVQAYLSYPHTPETMVTDYKTILNTLKG